MGGESPSNITQHLKGIDFPASKDDLINQAKKNGADRQVLDTLRQMPDEQYPDVPSIMKGYGQSH